MSFYDAIRVGASGAVDFEIERSLRFNDDDTAYLSRTPSSAGNRKKWTFSAWIKRGNLGGSAGEQRIFGGNANASHIYFPSNDEITWDLANEGSGSSSGNLNTTQVFRDPSAWFHLVCALDTDNSTADNRMRIYINGTEVTSFGSRSNPSSGYATNAMNNNTLHTLGYRTSGQGSAGMEFDGYMAEINFIDGQQYDPSYFGETDVLTGQWNPKKYTGSYGTNGFRLAFSDNSGTTATTLGKDSSGNGNNFTPNNFSVAAGIDNDSVVDTPSNNFPTLNPLSTFKNGSSSNTENANLRWNGVSNNQAGCVTSMAFPTSGKWYWEVKYLGSNSNFSFGITPAYWSQDINPSSPTGSIGYAAYGSKIVSGSETASWAASFTSSDVAAAALDMDNNEIKFYKNNSLQGTIALVSGYENVEYLAWIKGDTASTTVSSTINPGQQGFTYTPPTGFKALCSANLPDPTILLPNKHFDTLLYSGTGSSQNITGLEFKPDWVWIKKRSGSDNHNTADAVRGAGLSLRPNTTAAETTSSGAINAFLSNGFTVVDAGETNESGHTYVGWNWNAGDTDGKTYTVTVVSDSGNKYRFDGYGTSAVTLDLAEGGTYIFNMDNATNATHPFSIGTAANGTVYTSGITYFLDGVSKTYSQYTSGFSSATTRRLHITVPASAPVLYYWCSAHSGMGGQINTNSTLGSSNFDGSIQSTVKANTTAGFSIVGWTGTNGTGTIGHGLGVAPQAVIIRRRDSASDWTIFHQGIGNTKRFRLNDNAGASNSSAGWFNNTSPTSTVVSLGNDAGSNGSTDDYIAYCFADVSSFSKFGSYVGVGATGATHGFADGVFIYTGFRPALVMVKKTESEFMPIMDSKRDPDNFCQARLFPAHAYAESAEGVMDFVSNGFKARNGGGMSIISEPGKEYVYYAFAEFPFKNSRAR